jgi:hypothetical protein
MTRRGVVEGWFAERAVQGRGDDGALERVTIWIERRPGAVWAVGRAVDLDERPDGALHDSDYVFDGYELGDALAAANGALRGDRSASGAASSDVPDFTEEELLRPLEQWFFGRGPRARRRL